MGGCSKVIICFLIGLISFVGLGQENTNEPNKLTFEELLNNISKAKSVEEANEIVTIIIYKAKEENNEEFLIVGYHTRALMTSDKSMLLYCDSIIQLTENNPISVFPREAYQLKGDYFFNNHIYNRSLDNYLKVANYAEKENDIEKVIKAKYDIGTLKRRIGETEEALSLYKEGYHYIQNSEQKLDTVLYFGIVTAIANIYNDLKQPDSASYYNKLGYQKAKDYKKERKARHFALNQGVSLYYMGKYQEAIDSLEKYTPYYENTIRKRNLSLAYYYTGKSYAGLKNNLKAIDYYKKVDTVFQDKNTIFPIAKDSYSELIKYYKKKNDLKSQLLYVNQLIKVDSTLHKEEVYLSKGIYKKYDIPQLKFEKEQILIKMNATESLFSKVIWVGSIVLLIILISLLYQYRKRLHDKKKFDRIMNSIEADIQNQETMVENDIEVKPEKKKESSLDISQKAIDEILEGLKKFEDKQGYLSEKIKLNSLASELNTNSNYLSKVVNHYKKRSFANYLNELRVEYFIKQVKTDPTIRKFTIKAIAIDIGFRNSESFSKAFLKHKGIKPSYFLKELDKVKPKISRDS